MLVATLASKVTSQAQALVQVCFMLKTPVGRLHIDHQRNLSKKL